MSDITRCSRCGQPRTGTFTRRGRCRECLNKAAEESRKARTPKLDVSWQTSLYVALSRLHLGVLGMLMARDIGGKRIPDGAVTFLRTMAQQANAAADELEAKAKSA